MRMEILDSAKEELAETIAYYNIESEGLGFRFAYEVKRTLSRISQHPKAWPSISKRTRRCRISGFPYGIVYQIRKDVILIAAVMHLQRHPDSWKSRIKGN
ncbi:MAG: type II toxin-antitoxin system RelE/ParE family toxin [Chloroflexi bacterium]|nr:type II toxin-antitoxin system RelE/ParE family toxin [Chloroflexota bacterium]